LIDSVFGIGAIVGGLILSAWGGFKNMMLTSLSALAISGGAILLIGLAPSNGYVMALIGIAIFGIMNPIINGPLFATIQAKVSPELQGRVFSLLSAGAALTSPLGLAIAGPLTDATHNTQIWTIIAGVLTALVSLLTFPNQSIRKMGEDTEKADVQPA
jgi:DHA3 family macrolide efflux protein-like MFS transporter